MLVKMTKLRRQGEYQEEDGSVAMKNLGANMVFPLKRLEIGSGGCQIVEVQHLLYS